MKLFELHPGMKFFKCFFISASNNPVSVAYASSGLFLRSYLSYPPKISVSDLVKRLKGRSSRLMLDEFSELKKRYWGQHLWGIGYGAWSSGNITDEMIESYWSITKRVRTANRISFLNSFNELSVYSFQCCSQQTQMTFSQCL